MAFTLSRKQGIGDNKDKTYRRMVDTSGNPVCLIDEVFRKSAEKHGSVRKWSFAPNENMPAMVGFDKSGERRAIVCCVDEQ